MPGGKHGRREQNAPGDAGSPAPSSPGGPPSRKASPKVLVIAAVVVVAVVVAIVLAVTLGSSSKNSSSTTTGSSTTSGAVGSLKGALPGAAAVLALFAGIQQKGDELGIPVAPVTLVEYVDLQCPYCREFETVVLPKLLSQYVRTGKIVIQQRLLAFIGPDSATGRSAALAAGLQDKQFNFSELLYFNQGEENTGWLDANMVSSAGSSIPGLQLSQFADDQSSDQVKASAAKLDAQAKTDGVDSTPTILVGKTGGTLHQVEMSSPTDETSIDAAIQSALGV